MATQPAPIDAAAPDGSFDFAASGRRVIGIDGSATSLRAAVRAPWGEDPDLRAAVRRLREQGETVVCVLPGHEQENDEFECDRELVQAGGQWVLRSL